MTNNPLPPWPERISFAPDQRGSWHYERALSAALRARLEVATDAMLGVSRRVVDIADELSCVEPESECLRCHLYEARLKIVEALTQIGEVPE
jgi:hypothetical protein